MKYPIWPIVSIAVCLVIGSLIDGALIKPTSVLSTAVLTLCQPEATINSGDDIKMDGNCKLFVNGEDITVGNHVILNSEHHYTELPLTAIVKALGAKVEWKKDSTATITFDDKSYILNVADNSLVEAGTTLNILILAPGSQNAAFHQMIEDEFVVDCSSIMLLLHYIGVTIRIDYDTLSIYID